MTETATRVDEAFIRETGEEPEMPGHETALDEKPQWQPRYPGSGRLKGKVAIVTGGDSGIGRATAVLFAREGAKVAIAYLEEDDDAQITADAIAGEGSEALLWRGDLGDPAAGPDLVKQVIDKWGRLDVLVNNAGEQHPDEEVTDITAEQLQRTFQTNIYSMFYLVQAARGHAFLRGRGYALPQDILDMAHDVIRHRLVLSYEALSDEVTSDDLLNEILDRIPIPEVPLREYTNVRVPA